ncbi:TetR/AcrR family transcriptional regulator [Solicola sp. PLA-1-18]|uniref:TetR/AcrR family transcriptional regulator n=1 Tax=Solicola sp. PLA-1-18 TaxID=3380532 RepID=UPI003B76C555
MTAETAAPDRRAALKARHRQAILDAADALIGERGSRQFSVDELAERADVARRTVFNHFASLDEVVMTACTRVLTGAVEEFRAATAATPVGDGSPAALFDELTAAMLGVDLPAVIAYISGVLGDDHADPRSHHLIQDVFTRCTDEMAAELTARSADGDGLEAQILVSSMINGLAVVAERWIEETGGSLEPASRAAWDELLDRLVATVRRGYAPSA